jgi:hydroxymethylglutaryl-CoA lyase
VVFGAASEAFSQKNINCSIAESIERFAPVVQAARDKGIYVRGAISCAVGCPYEGEIAPERVELVAGLMKQIGVQHVGVADTIGVGTPRKVQRAMEAALKHYALDDVSGHFHDTYGQALGNTWPRWKWACGSTTPRRRPGRLPLCQGRHRQRGDRRRGLHAARHGHRDRHRPGPLIDAGKYISDHLGRKPNSRASTAILNKRAG